LNFSTREAGDRQFKLIGDLQKLKKGFIRYGVRTREMRLKDRDYVVGECVSFFDGTSCPRSVRRPERLRRCHDLFKALGRFPQGVVGGRSRCKALQESLDAIIPVLEKKLFEVSCGVVK
jgi:hypothetical protein